MNNRIEKPRDLWLYVRESIVRYVADISQKGGISLHVRRITAQILWLLLGYLVIKKLIPITDVFLSNSIIAVFLALLSQLWSVIQKRVPEFITEFIKGDIFYSFEGRILNLTIFSLFALNLILIFIPFSYIKKLKK